MTRPSAKRFPVSLEAAFRGIVDTWIWMAFVSGSVPAEIITQRNAAKLLSGDARRSSLSRSSLSRAERRQWKRLARQLR
jgi:hypothetical protein